MMTAIERYTPDRKNEWDAFVSRSRNATFLFFRDYMDYHADRFIDHSLLFRDRQNRITALLPASIDRNQLKSHGGLTYGGLLLSDHVTATDMLDMMDALIEYAATRGITDIIYKAIPHIYHTVPSEEDSYALFRHGATVQSVLMSSVVDLTAPLPFNENARRAVRHAAASGVTVSESSGFNRFWSILTTLLKEKYDTAPVHTLDEITLLHSRFPDNIRLFTAEHDGEIVAGTVIYFTRTTAHAQYIASTPRGRELKALPLLFEYIMKQHCGAVRYFDFGTSNEDAGRYLNEGLIRQKCGMGARGIAYTTYHLTTTPRLADITQIRY